MNNILNLVFLNFNFKFAVISVTILYLFVSLLGYSILHRPAKTREQMKKTEITGCIEHDEYWETSTNTYRVVCYK